MALRIFCSCFGIGFADTEEVVAYTSNGNAFQDEDDLELSAIAKKIKALALDSSSEEDEGTKGNSRCKEILTASRYA